MLTITIILIAVSAISYIILALVGLEKKPVNFDETSLSSGRSYIWGFLFTALFYYGFPLWWWRYGLWRAVHLILTCVGIGILIQMLLRTIGAIYVDSIGDSIFAGLLLSVPIRALAGVWVAHKDQEWRQAIISKRASRLPTVQP